MKRTELENGIAKQLSSVILREDEMLENIMQMVDAHVNKQLLLPNVVGQSEQLHTKVFNLANEVKIVFKNDEGKTKEITVTVKQLLENTTDDFYEWLDDTEPCTSASCNNESQNFCDCGSIFEDYVISEVLF